MSKPGELTYIKIKSIESIKKITTVYNLEVSPPTKNFFAEKILVHNCSMGCTYCFAYSFKSLSPALKSAKNPYELKSVDAEKFLGQLTGNAKDARGRLFYKHFYSKKFPIHWGGLADPFCYFEKKNEVGLQILDGLGAIGYPTLISFKGPAIMNQHYIDVLEKYKHQNNFAFQVSIVTPDDELSKQIEIGVPKSSLRLKALKMLSDMGYHTILRMRPFIMGITDVGQDRLMQMALEAGVSGITTEFFSVDIRSTPEVRKKYKVIGDLTGIDDMLEYYKKLSPSERGGYMRLNRNIKEHAIKKLYLFCHKHGLVFGCGDPDFKELNSSGNCCGLALHYLKNEALENWTKHQVAWHLREARRILHTTGEIKDLKFKECYNIDNVSYFNDVELLNDSVTLFSMCNAERGSTSYGTIIQEHWNNLRSRENPRNYFHGKVLPVGVDSDDNIIYRYNPSDYEQRWTEEGIDLSWGEIDEKKDLYNYSNKPKKRRGKIK